MKEEFEVARKRVTIYRIGAQNLTLKADDGGLQNAARAPIVFYNAFANEADEIARALGELGDVSLTLAAVSGLEWNSEMTPWPMPALFKKELPFEGGAYEYLSCCAWTGRSRRGSTCATPRTWTSSTSSR